jgi:hypothetical protein
MRNSTASGATAGTGLAQPMFDASTARTRRCMPMVVRLGTIQARLRGEQFSVLSATPQLPELCVRTHVSSQYADGVQGSYVLACVRLSKLTFLASYMTSHFRSGSERDVVWTVARRLPVLLHFR